MGNYNRDDNRSGGYRGGGGFSRGGGRGGFGGGRSSFGGGRSDDRGNREMFSAVCSDCGKECQVPFRPTGSKPVYCSDCFEKVNGGRSDSRRPGRSDFSAPAPSFDQSKAQLDAINVKLDKILSILAPAPVVKVAKEVRIEPEKIEEIKKVVKKTVKKVASEKKE
jgi:CxxC-x17-CxxC domain-containing protein